MPPRIDPGFLPTPRPQDETGRFWPWSPVQPIPNQTDPLQQRRQAPQQIPPDPGGQFQWDDTPNAPVTPVSEAGPAANVALGPLPGKLNRRPHYDSLGKIRPLGPGEFLSNPDGSWSSEMTTSVPVGNQWWVVPTLWMIDGIPHRVSEDQAAEYAQKSGLQWPTFDSANMAQQYANHRETIWQRTPFGRSDALQPLWSRPWPPR